MEAGRLDGVLAGVASLRPPYAVSRCQLEAVEPGVLEAKFDPQRLVADAGKRLGPAHGVGDRIALDRPAWVNPAVTRLVSVIGL